MTGARRVLFVTPYYPPAHLGGIERAIERLATALHRRQPSLESAVLSTHFGFPPHYVPGLPAQERRPEALVLRWPSRPRAALPLFPWYSCPVTWFGPGPLLAILRQLEPDVIHLVGDGWAWAHLLLAALRAPSTAMVFTPSFHRMTPSRQWLRFPNRLLCAAAERTIVLTRQEQADLPAVYHAPPERLRLVPWGVASPPTGVGTPTGERRRGDQAAGAAPESVRILCVGRLGPHKGQRWLLATYAAARAGFRRPARLILVGKDEGDGAALRSDVARLGLDAEVEVTGEVSDADLQTEYARADIFALFSRFEAFGLVYLEAMAHGVPVLSHRLGAGASLLTAGAVLTAADDRPAAAAALAKLVNDDSWRARLGAEARALVAGRYSWERCASGTLLAYDEALATRRLGETGH